MGEGRCILVKSRDHQESDKFDLIMTSIKILELDLLSWNIKEKGF